MEVVRNGALDLDALGQVLGRLVNPMPGPDSIGQAEDPVNALGQEFESVVADVRHDGVSRISGFVRPGSGQPIHLNVKDVSVGDPKYKLFSQLPLVHYQDRVQQMTIMDPRLHPCSGFPVKSGRALCNCLEQVSFTNLCQPD